MKFVFAPDSFKGSLTALESTEILKNSALKHFPDAITQQAPVADGGEGTVEALVIATSGTYRYTSVQGPMGIPVSAKWGVLGDGETDILEMAQASGLPLMNTLDPLRATSIGTGELIKEAMEQGYKKMYIGIGGSATNDGGMGLLTALGIEFLDREGKPVSQGAIGLGSVDSVDFSKVNPKLKDTEITVICDVNNPLLGDNGASYIYGPQKGVTPELLPLIEMSMSHYANVMETALQKDISSFPGAGAAGGVGAALAGVLDCKIKSGIMAVLEAVHFDEMLKDADLVITGEGLIDAQSVSFGKVVAGVARRARAYDVPVVAIVGGMKEGAQALYRVADSTIMTTVCGVMPIEDALTNVKSLYKSAADRTFRMLKIGMRLKEGKTVKLTIQEILPTHHEILKEMMMAYYEKYDFVKEELREEVCQTYYDKVQKKEIMGNICLYGDTPIGFAFYRLDTEEWADSQLPGYGRVLEMGIAVKHHKKGFGKKILRFIEDELFHLKAEGIYVLGKGERTKFFTQQGYEHNGKYTEEHLPFLVMEKGQ